MILQLIAGAAIAAIACTRLLSARSAREAAVLERARTVSASGIQVGAESIHLTGTNDRCALLLHGFNDTPQSLAHLGRALNARGWTVSIPLLPQHGRGAATIVATGNSADWIGAARAAWTSTRATSPTAVLIGQSMGGAIAADLSIEAPPATLILLAPYLHMKWTGRSLATIWPVWQIFVPTLRSRPERAIRDEDARARALGGTRFSPRLVGELLKVVRRGRAALPLLKVPTLVINAHSDYRIPSDSAQKSFDLIGAHEKQIVWINRGGHVVAADEGRDEVVKAVMDWLDRRAPTIQATGTTFDAMRNV